MTNPTPEAIEAAARALGSSPNRADWSLKLRDAEDALTAAAPFIATQAKAEALREAADNLPATCGEICYAPSRLRTRAATFLGEV